MQFHEIQSKVETKSTEETSYDLGKMRGCPNLIKQDHGHLHDPQASNDPLLFVVYSGELHFLHFVETETKLLCSRNSR